MIIFLVIQGRICIVLTNFDVALNMLRISSWCSPTQFFNPAFVLGYCEVCFDNNNKKKPLVFLLIKPENISLFQNLSFSISKYTLAYFSKHTDPSLHSKFLVLLHDLCHSNKNGESNCLTNTNHKKGSRFWDDKNKR